MLELSIAAAYNATARRSVSPLTTGLSNRPLEDSPMPIHDDATITRFWSKVDRRGPDECWPWKASKSNDGYGSFHLRHPKRHNTTAQRVAFEIAIGDIGTLHVLHRCDNPPCCNPGHLFLGTNTDNVHDMVAKNRRKQPNTRGEKSGAAKLNERQVWQIRELLSQGMLGVTIAGQFGVSAHAVSGIKTRRVWGWLGDNPGAQKSTENGTLP